MAQYRYFSARDGGRTGDCATLRSPVAMLVALRTATGAAAGAGRADESRSRECGTVGTRTRTERNVEFKR